MYLKNILHALRVIFEPTLLQVSYISTSFPYILLSMVLVKLLTLKGSGIGIAAYITADFSALMKKEVLYIFKVIAGVI